ncbi:MAG TPA: hypothetical protein VEJ63_09270 [Planctomycetota bacterium]|nr:hypothetical protein [Planctomycetota bacterium]
MVQFEKPSKSGNVKFAEGLIILLLLATVIGAAMLWTINFIGNPRKESLPTVPEPKKRP